VSTPPPVEGQPLVWILSGLSGAGKRTALTALEAAGVACVDNLPVDLVDGFCALPRTETTVAVVDARQGELVARYEPVPGTRCVFLDARDDVLVRRISESTRPHPCATAGRGPAAVQAERRLLEPMRAAADVVIDTSDVSAEELRARVVELVWPPQSRPAPAITVTLTSFGFKYGVPLDAEWIVDSRLMVNPFWEPELRPLSGLDAPVRDFVLQQHEAKELLHRLHELLRWSLPRYLDHRRRFLHVLIGCTGGRHRSVVLVERLADDLRKDEYAVLVHHRDVHRADATP
jgi:RNase adapter protein RapZ